MGFTPFPGAGSLAVQASTGLAGFALQNATPGIISWQVPNDGQMHRVMVLVNSDVTVAQTGGAVGLTVTLPDGTVIAGAAVLGGGLGTGGHNIGAFGALVKAGSTVTVSQTTAQTLGACTVWAEIWGS